jgi:hypothetical protein
MYLALPRRAAPWIARAIPAALLALATIALLLASRPLFWLSTALVLAVVGAALLAIARRRSPGTSAPTTAFVGS